MVRSGGFEALGVSVSAILALVTSYLLSDSNRTLSRWYCTSESSSAFITTLNPSLPHARCFRVQNGIFMEVLVGMPEIDVTQITFLDGYVLPGIIESHGHILQYGEMLESVSLYGAQSMEEVRARVKVFLKKHDGEGYGSRDKWVRVSIQGAFFFLFGSASRGILRYLLSRHAPRATTPNTPRRSNC